MNVAIRQTLEDFIGCGSRNVVVQADFIAEIKSSFDQKKISVRFFSSGELSADAFEQFQSFVAQSHLVALRAFFKIPSEVTALVFRDANRINMKWANVLGAVLDEMDLCDNPEFSFIWVTVEANQFLPSNIASRLHQVVKSDE